MAPKEEPSGLLSRVVKFVTNPATSWGGLDQPAADGDALVSRQMLKEMIERKRRNDFVRKREFDMLRKMRRTDLMAGQDHSNRHSLFQSSIISRIDDRAVTLKKIDDIEAQMAMQWWKTNHGDGTPGAGNTGQVPLGVASGPAPVGGAQASRSLPPSGSREPTVPGDLPSLIEYEYSGGQSLGAAPALRRASDSSLDELLAAPTVGAELREDPPPDDPGNSSGFGGLEVGSGNGSLAALIAEQPEDAVPVTAPVAVAPRAAVAAPPAMTAVAPVVPAAPVAATVTPVKGFDAPHDDAGQEFTHDPELEEASIRFANGDDAGAEAGLLEVLGPGGSRIDHDETWLALFDLHRAIGAHDRFETAALDFARRFGRSAPPWVSFPDAVSRMNLPSARAAAPGTAVADWSSPSLMGLQTVAAMNAALARSPRPWRLNWVKLNSIDRAAVDGLKRAFTKWSSEPLALHFLAPEKLENVLAKATPSGDATVDPAWWQLRMELLRVMNRPDEFEMVALDYCVTFEVSPPSWEKVACKFKPLQADGSPISTPTIIGEPFHDSVPASSFMDMGRPSTVCTVELAGEILGDASEAMAMLEARLGAAESLVISCSRLIRIDFSAAGMLLNWVAALASEGHQVQFTEVHRLVAGFFSVIAITEHARVVVRAH